jgi:hypothetical protein
VAAGLTLMLSCPGWLTPADGATTTLTAATTTTLTAPVQTPHGGEFLSPSGNISCEIDNGYIGLHQVYCQTISPAESVVLARTGTFKVCKGQRCLGNPAVNTPVLTYGHSTSSGPFRCLSATAGVACTVGGKGFQISRSGITAVRPRISS